MNCQTNEEVYLFIKNVFSVLIDAFPVTSLCSIFFCEVFDLIDSLLELQIIANKMAVSFKVYKVKALTKNIYCIN